MHRKVNKVENLNPKQEFYNLFNDEQIDDIISSLELYREVPRQYNYFDEGAEHWERYIKRLAIEGDMNTLTSTIELLRVNMDYIASLIYGYSSVNVVDIGAGNAYPVREFLQNLLRLTELGRYVALDISPSMLKLARRNIKSWFSDSIAFEGYEYDVSKYRFSDLLVDKSQENIANKSMRLVLLLGGTLSNMRDPDSAYRMIRNSMTEDDRLVHVTKLDSEVNRKYFDFNASSVDTLSANHRIVFELLNIDEKFYDVEMKYDSLLNQRYIRVCLKVSIRIAFMSNNKKRHVFLKKGETILIWRGIHHTENSIVDQFTRNNFSLMHMSQTEDCNYMFTVSCIK